MDFAAPAYGLLALPVIVILLLRLRGERKRDEDMRHFAEPHLLPRLTGLRPGIVSRLSLPAAILLLLIAALMRPQWGVLEQERTSAGLDVIFAIDLSRSMLADDLSPSRLAIAKRAVGKALDSLAADRVGIIGFAGTAFTLCPPTSDHDMVSKVLGDLGTGTLPKGGSSLASALEEAGRAFRGTAAGGRLLVLLSDGEDHGGDMDRAIAGLRQEGVAVMAVLTGTPAGGLMVLPDGSYVKDRQGAVVMSRADISTLKLIDPSATVISADRPDLEGRIAASRAVLHASVHKEVRHRSAERYYVPLAAALAIWCLGLLLPGGRFES